MGFWSVCFLPIFILVRVEAVPPEACFANFNWNDCGKPPEPVMYYWKPGSRCEVGLWRGCLPNLNMFTDEYDCVTTCIFAARAIPEDYHSLNDNEIEEKEELEMDETTESVNGTKTEITDAEGGNSITTEAVTATGEADADGTGATDGTVGGDKDAGGDGGDGDGDSTVKGDQSTTDAGDTAATASAAE